MNNAESTMESTAKQATEGLQSALEAGAQTLKSNLGKVLGSYDRIVGLSKETVSALGKAANAAEKGADNLHDEFWAYSRRSIENSLDATSALFRVKSLEEALEVQSGFAKAAYEAYTDEVAKLSEIARAATHAALKPLQGRLQAWADVVQSAWTA